MAVAVRTERVFVDVGIGRGLLAGIRGQYLSQRRVVIRSAHQAVRDGAERKYHRQSHDERGREALEQACEGGDEFHNEPG